MENLLPFDYVTNALNNLIDEEEKYEYLSKKYNNMSIYVLIKCMSTLPNKYRVKFYLSHYRYKYSSVEYVKKLLTDKQKGYFLKDFTEEEKSSILTFTLDKNVLKKYINTIKNTKQYLILLARTEDLSLILDSFLKSDNLFEKYMLINFVKDISIKKVLISLLEDKEVSYFLMSNYTYINSSKEVESLYSQTKIDKDITIGIELECCNKNISKFNKFRTIYKDYIITSDPSVIKGFEIVSPILHYSLSDMNTLNNVCALLKKCNFYTDDTCGGHIHIGSDYLKSENEILMLLYLYIYTEDILYYITDKEGSVKRSGASTFAIKSKDDYMPFIKDGKLDYKKLKRNKGLNLKNIGTSFKNTIEFRMPNGQIEFPELLANIKLFSRLIEVSHDLVNMSFDNELYVKAFSLYRITDESKKLEILLEILFPNEKDRLIYLKRYETNKELTELQNKEKNVLVKKKVIN